MTATAKTVSAAMLAAVLTLALFLSPVGVSSAQEDSTDDPATEDTTPDTDDTAPDTGADEADRPGRGDREPLTDEEREALQAEREVQRQAFLDDVAGELGTTSDALVAAFKTAAINRVEAKVADGTLTQEQADEIITRIEESDGLAGGFGFGRGGPGHGGRGHHGGPGADDASAADDQEI